MCFSHSFLLYIEEKLNTVTKNQIRPLFRWLDALSAALFNPAKICFLKLEQKTALAKDELSTDQPKHPRCQ